MTSKSRDGSADKEREAGVRGVPGLFANSKAASRGKYRLDGPRRRLAEGLVSGGIDRTGLANAIWPNG